MTPGDPKFSARRGHRRPRQALDRTALEALALRYVGRYATTRSKLRAYLRRKLDERGWADEGTPSIDPLVERMAELGYVDDGAFATARAASLQRRGYGEHRIAQALTAAGIAADEMAEVRSEVAKSAMIAAMRFAERRGLGPYATEKADRAGREKGFAAMMRAGHPIDIIRAVLELAPGDVPDPGAI